MCGCGGKDRSFTHLTGATHFVNSLLRREEDGLIGGQNGPAGPHVETAQAPNTFVSGSIMRFTNGPSLLNSAVPSAIAVFMLFSPGTSAAGESTRR